MHGVLDDAADVRIVEGTVRLVARLEIEDLAVAAGEGAAAAEDFADVIPALENNVVRGGNVKVFAVALFNAELEMLRNTVCDGVGRLYVEKTLVGAVAPFQRTCGAV